MTAKIKPIKLGIYEKYEVPVIFAFCSCEQLQELCLDCFNTEIDLGQALGSTTDIVEPTFSCVLCGFHDGTPNTIAHELIHVIGFIFEIIGEIPVFDERVAYTFGEMTDLCLDLQATKGCAHKDVVKIIRDRFKLPKRKR